MKGNRKSQWIGVAAVISLLAVVSASAPPVHAANPNPGVIPPNATPYGMTYGEWSARWWQWALSLPVDENPFFDEDGDCTNGANGQLGPVWFLTGVLNESGTAERDCTVPVGKALFFPLINVECSTVEEEPFFGADEDALRACATGFNFSDVYATIDGRPVRNLEAFHVVSPLFSFTLPDENVLGLEGGTTGESVSYGYYLMVPPLSAGAHKIEFGGTYADFEFSLAITYNLTVVLSGR
jgi:hypothetical protein